MSRILGISAYYHDAAAALVRDGTIVGAAQEERFSRKKHDPRFPAEAIRYCLEEAGLSLRDLSLGIGWGDSPLPDVLRYRRFGFSTLRRAADWHWNRRSNDHRSRCG